MLDAKNVDSKLSADIQFANAFPDPAFWYFHLNNGVLLVELYVVEDMVGSVSDRCPFCHLFFRVDYMVCTVAKQKLCLHITLGTRYHALCPQLLQQRGGFQRVLKITADGHDADVKISDAKRAKKLRVCTVANLCVGDIWQHITDSFLVCIDRHDLMPQLRKLYCDMPSEAACANQ